MIACWRFFLPKLLLAGSWKMTRHAHFLARSPFEIFRNLLGKWQFLPVYYQRRLLLTSAMARLQGFMRMAFVLLIWRTTPLYLISYHPLSPVCPERAAGIDHIQILGFNVDLGSFWLREQNLRFAVSTYFLSANGIAAILHFFFKRTRSSNVTAVVVAKVFSLKSVKSLN